MRQQNQIYTLQFGTATEHFGHSRKKGGDHGWMRHAPHYRETPKPRERFTSTGEFNGSLHTRKPLDMVHHEGQVRCTIQVVEWDTEARYMWIRPELLDT